MQIDLLIFRWKKMCYTDIKTRWDSLIPKTEEWKNFWVHFNKPSMICRYGEHVHRVLRLDGWGCARDGHTALQAISTAAGDSQALRRGSGITRVLHASYFYKWNNCNLSTMSTCLCSSLCTAVGVWAAEAGRVPELHWVWDQGGRPCSSSDHIWESAGRELFSSRPLG